MEFTVKLKCPSCGSYDMFKLLGKEQEACYRNNAQEYSLYCRGCKRLVIVSFDQKDSREHNYDVMFKLNIAPEDFNMEEYLGSEYVEFVISGRLLGMLDVEKWRKLSVEHKLNVMEFSIK